MNEQLIQTKLHNQTQANDSDRYVRHSRFYYTLTFTKEIGWDWLYSQVRKVSEKLDIDLELWEIEPAAGAFCVTVREVDRRSGIDKNQQNLFNYE